MTEHEASRTLVKSPPELWAECSDAASLARHLGEFGEITITRLDPETAVAWEGELASGTVRIEPSGWGTRVTLTAQVEGVEVVEAEPEPAAEPEPVVQAEPGAEDEAVVEAEPQRVSSADLLARAGFFSKMRMRLRPRPAVGPSPAPAPKPEPVAVAEPEPVVEPEPVAVAPPQPEPEPSVDARSALTAALDSLGQAHHRPFSRA